MINKDHTIRGTRNPLKHGLHAGVPQGYVVSAPYNPSVIINVKYIYENIF